MADIAKLQAEIEVRQARIDELVSLEDITPELDAELTEAVEAQRSAIDQRDALEARAGADSADSTVIPETGSAASRESV